MPALAVFASAGICLATVIATWFLSPTLRQMNLRELEKAREAPVDA